MWDPSSARLLVLVPLLACGPSLATDAEEPPGDPIASVDASELFQRGVALAQRGDHIRAEQYLSAAIARGAPEARVLPVLLRVCIAGSRLRMALSYAQPYLLEHPNDWSLRYLVASIHRALGETTEATESLERVVAAVPDEPAPHYLLGVLLAEHDEHGAREHLERYLELDPSGPRAGAAAEALRTMESSQPSPGDESPTPPAESAPTSEAAEESETEEPNRDSP